MTPTFPKNQAKVQVREHSCLRPQAQKKICNAHLVNSYRFSPEFDLVHNLTGIFSILFREELAEAISLMSH
jgi:hypothetical protein